MHVKNRRFEILDFMHYLIYYTHKLVTYEYNNWR